MLEAVDINLLLLLLVLAFLASFVDSVVGGGGLIMLPALLFVGLTPASAVATNKLAGTMSSFTSTIMFMRSGKLNIKEVGKLLPLTFIGSLIGAWTVTHIDSSMLKPLMLTMLIVVFLYTLLKKDFGAVSYTKKVSRKKSILFLISILSIGFYDGFLGPGTGTFLIFMFLLMGYNFIKSAGNAKLLNFGSNIAALLFFMSIGNVNYAYGLPMGLAAIAGAIIGSQFAIKQGVRYVRWLFIIVTLLLLINNGMDYLFK